LRAEASETRKRNHPIIEAGKSVKEHGRSVSGNYQDRKKWNTGLALNSDKRGIAIWLEKEKVGDASQTGLGKPRHLLH